MRTSQPRALDGGDLSSALRASPRLAAALLDTDLRYVGITERLAEMNGVPVAAHLGRTVGEILPSAPEWFLDRMREVVKTGIALADLEPVIITPAFGRTRSSAVSIDPVFRDGVVAGALVLVTDVTARQRAEREREEALRLTTALSAYSQSLASAVDVAELAEQGLEALVAGLGADHARFIVVEDDGDPRLRFAASIGYPPGQLQDVMPAGPVYRSIRDRRSLAFETPAELLDTHPEFARAARELVGVEALLATPLAVNGEALGAITVSFAAPHRFSDAERHFVESLASVAAQALERRRLVELGQRSQTTFEAVLDQMPVGVLVVDRRGRRVRNRMLDELCRGGRQEDGDAAVEERIASLGASPASPPSQAHPARELSEIVIDDEVDYPLRDGSTRQLSISSAPVRDASGSVLASVGIILDTTDRREAQLAREAFIGVLSHELRTPVTSIYAAARLLGRTVNDPTTRQELLDDVAGEAERLERLIEDLLIVSRVERGVRLEANEPVLVQRAIERVVRERSLSWGGLQVDVDVMPDLPAVVGDHGAVEQVLRNLIGNAAKYARGEVRVMARASDEGVITSVLDNGPGLSLDDLPLLFQLFYRAEHAKRKTSGSGIGLYVVRQLVTAMGGHVWAENHAEGGAAFHFVLRRYTLDDELEPEEA